MRSGVASVRYCLRLTAAPTTVMSTLSLHDALPISDGAVAVEIEGGVDAAKELAEDDEVAGGDGAVAVDVAEDTEEVGSGRSEEHTSELQSHSELVCRLLLVNKKYN